MHRASASASVRGCRKAPTDSFHAWRWADGTAADRLRLTDLQPRNSLPRFCFAHLGNGDALRQLKLGVVGRAGAGGGRRAASRRRRRRAVGGSLDAAAALLLQALADLLLGYGGQLRVDLVEHDAGPSVRLGLAGGWRVGGAGYGLWRQLRQRVVPKLIAARRTWACGCGCFSPCCTQCQESCCACTSRREHVQPGSRESTHSFPPSSTSPFPLYPLAHAKAPVLHTAP